MPRPHHQLDNHRNYIEQTLLNYKSIKSIHQDLYQNFGYTGIALTIHRRINFWRFAISAKQTRISDIKELYDRIYKLIFQYNLTDTEMLWMLRTKSFFIIEYRLKIIRFNFSLYRWYNIERLQTIQNELQRFFKYEYITENLVHQINREAFYIYIYQRIYIIV